jgi:ABC-type multidrug transport system ATPase subunit
METLPMPSETFQPDPTADPRIRAVGLTRKFGFTKAVDRVSLEVPAGQILGDIGLNGAGKTTLLNLLAGILTPTSGHVTVMGLDRWKQNMEIRRRATFLPALPESFFIDIPYGHLRILSQIYGLPHKEFMRRANHLARQMKMTEHWHKPWGGMSLGMMKKIGLIGAFLPDADVRILDEPFAGGIDPLAMEMLYRWMVERRTAGETIIFSTQVLEQAESICDRILVLEKGAVRWLGTPDELIRHAGLDPVQPRAFARAFTALATGIHEWDSDNQAPAP